MQKLKLTSCEKEFKADAMDLRISEVWEGGKMTSLYQTWGV